jgi:hypothetical protein
LLLFSEIIRQRVFSHLAVPSHIWNTSPGVFYAAPDQLYMVGDQKEEEEKSVMDNFTAIVFTISEPPVTSFKVRRDLFMFSSNKVTNKQCIQTACSQIPVCFYTLG